MIIIRSNFRNVAFPLFTMPYFLIAVKVSLTLMCKSELSGQLLKIEIFELYQKFKFRRSKESSCLTNMLGDSDSDKQSLKVF